ncbi:MAG: hypothetical protein V1893_03600 [Candidatus Omnitrophota bacterium]
MVKKVIVLGSVCVMLGMLVCISCPMAQEEEKKPMVINATKWSVALTPMAEKKGQSAINDTLSFNDGKFTSEAFAGKGYPVTNYSLSLKDDGKTIWETMQSKDDDEKLFWHGELNTDGKSMRGVVSERRMKKTKKAAEEEVFDYTLYGVKLEAVETTLPAVTPPPAVDQPKPVPEEKNEETKKDTPKNK